MSNPKEEPDVLSVLIVEDDAGARSRLTAAIEDQADMALLNAVATLSDARRLIKQRMPDVLLVDLGLPDGDGNDLINEVTAASKHCEIMVITVFGDEKHVLRAIEAGASGYLLKEEDKEQIGHCIRQLVAGGSPMSASIARHLLTRYRKTNSLSPGTGSARQKPNSPALTDRELDVLRLIAKGYNSNEISTLIDVTYHTVTTHVRNIYRKLAVHSRSEAIFEAVQRGLVELGT
ncbi:MAG: response regulator [Thiotrichales bacterium]